MHMWRLNAIPARKEEPESSLGQQLRHIGIMATAAWLGLASQGAAWLGNASDHPAANEDVAITRRDLRATLLATVGAIVLIMVAVAIGWSQQPPPHGSAPVRATDSN